MNRPYWLDFIYLAVFFLLPALTAAVATAILSNLFELSGAIWFLTYFAIFVMSTILLLIALKRRDRSRESKK